jgi:HD-GYP domain-containing protein (c-di-GMP phosphodiesterase class II)
MNKISKKFNILLVMSISLSVILASIITTGLLILRSEKENHKHNLIQLKSLSDNMEGFFTTAYTLNYQLSLNPIIINNVLEANENWESRKSKYSSDFLTEGLEKGFPILEEMGEQYRWVELFFVQDAEGFQTARSSGELGDRSTRWWLKKIRENPHQKPFISKSYFSMTGNIPVASVFHPLFNDGERIGIIGTDINFSILQEMIGGYLYSDTMKAILVDSTGTVVAHPNPEVVSGLYNLLNNTKQIMRLGNNGQALLDERGYHLTQPVSAGISPSLQTATTRLLAGEEGFIKGVIIDNSLCSLYFKPVSFPGAIKGEFYGIILINDHSQLIRFVLILLGGIILMIILGTLLLYLLFHSLFEAKILTPLGILISAMQNKNITDFDRVYLNTEDEFDILAETYNNLRTELAHTHKELQKKMKELALSEEGYREFATISLSMAAEKKKGKVLKQIVRTGMDLCQAEGGTLYLHNSQEHCLDFEILINDTLDINKLKSELGSNFFPPVPLLKEGEQNNSNVSSYCANTEELVNIENVYEAEGLDFSGMKEYDRKNNYRSLSMLVVPMKNLEGQIIGVLQLINAHLPQSNEIIPFSEHHENIIFTLATLGAVTLTNIQLYKNHEDFLYSFVKSVAFAIDEKSSYTSGHIERVEKLTGLISQSINKTESGKFKDFKFSKEELEELRMAAWMHDVGKILISEAILDKSSKLMLIEDQYDLIKTRAHLITVLWEIESYKKSSTSSLPQEMLAELEMNKERMLQNLALIKKSNEALGRLGQEDIETLEKISHVSANDGKKEITLLTPKELHFLSIMKGTLDDEEKKIMESHVTSTRKMLEQLPFPQHLSQVPLYAYQHHERLDGSGYDAGVSGEDLPIQSRIIAIADILEALTAHDRPYRKPLSQEKAMNILQSMSQEGLIDSDIVKIMNETGLVNHFYKNH